MTPARVIELWRFPVKSLVGEAVLSIDVNGRGFDGDREWSVKTEDGRLGSGKTGRRFTAVPGLLDVRAAIVEGRVLVTYPDGTQAFADDPAAEERLSVLVGRRVSFDLEGDEPHFDDGPVSLMGSASLAALSAEQGTLVDRTRFRANVIVATDEAFVEDTWVGRDIEVGAVRLHVDKMLPRCVMVNMSTADLPEQPGNLTALGRIHQACMGVVASVVGAGRMSVGDIITI